MCQGQKRLWLCDNKMHNTQIDINILYNYVGAFCIVANDGTTFDVQNVCRMYIKT